MYDGIPIILLEEGLTQIDSRCIVAGLHNSERIHGSYCFWRSMPFWMAVELRKDPIMVLS